MQVVNQVAGTSFPFSAGDLNRDFGVKVQIKDDERNDIQAGTETEEEEEEFSFDCLNPDGSPISADDVFQNGKIRPVYPFLNDDLVFANGNDAVSQSPLKKVFVEDSAETTPYGGGRIVVEKTSPDTCKKSNSTGFSKLWRFKDLLSRSNSDGKDAFVFLNQTTTMSSSSSSSSSSLVSSSLKTEKKSEKGNAMVKPKAKKVKTASVSAHEKLYVKNRAMREGEKRRSYLPYKQFGFLTNVNRLSRNLHPF